MTIPTSPPANIQNPLHLVAQMKSTDDGLQLEQQLLANLAAIAAGLQQVNTVHFAHWFFLDNHTRVILVTEFDGDFTTYIKDFIAAIGDIFNVLLSHVVDAPPLPVQANPDSFVTWVSDHNVPVAGQLFSAYPGATVVDIVAALQAQA